jgi:hypothetical protein
MNAISANGLNQRQMSFSGVMVMISSSPFTRKTLSPPPQRGRAPSEDVRLPSMEDHQ